VSCANNSKLFTANSPSGKLERALREKLLVPCAKKAIFGVPVGNTRQFSPKLLVDSVDLNDVIS
jgi:hypothetical protein